MKAKLRDGWTAKLEYFISGVKAVDSGFTPAFVPDFAWVSFLDGKFQEIVVVGPRVLKNGRISKSIRDTFSWDDDLDEAPAWVRDEVVALAEQTMRSVK